MSVTSSKVLVATDGSAPASLATREAADLAGKSGAELHVVHVGEVPSMYHPEMRGYRYRSEASEMEARELLDGEADRLRAAGTDVAGAHLRMGRIDAEIVELAEDLDADLVVVGSRGLGGVRRALMGSVSDSVARHAHCPVLVAREKRTSRREPEAAQTG